MFLALDESLEGDYKVIGCLVMPIAVLPDFEKKFVELRLKHKLWGEIGWNNIDQYQKRYCDFTDLVLENGVCFQSLSYKEPTDDEVKTYYGGDRKKIPYKHAYVLVRNVAWKIDNAGLPKNLYIVPDATGSLGSTEWGITRTLLASDRTLRKFKQEFCSTGHSHISGAIQICDIITGAVCAAKNKKPLNKDQQHVVNHLMKINNGIPLNHEAPVPPMPALHLYKISHFTVEHPSRR